MPDLRTLALALALSAAPLSRVAAEEGVVPLTIELGETVALCKTGTIICPAGAATCVDLAVAEPVGTKAGLGLAGRKLGRTRCSARSSSGAGGLVHYDVEVVPPRPPPEGDRRAPGARTPG